MKKICFIFSIHNHQPIGNFRHVFEQAFSRAYKPFLTLLEKHPLIKTTLHYSGPLLEWMEAEEPELFERIHHLVDRKQVEILSGGFYEPIFPILREADVLGQIGMMNTFLQDKFATTPKGCWITERVWDPVLPRLICSGGLSYTLLDSTHFLHTGLPPEHIHGYYVTEREGKSLALFPIDMRLRYTIPFEPPEKTIAYLRYLASDAKESAVTYGDDGEKFGLWPDTYAWVYEQGWLEAFFSELEKHQDMIHMMTCSEYRENHPPEGLIYIPSLSYEEMMAWALPAEAAARYEDMLKNLDSLHLKDKYRSFLNGGYWNNFLAKYPESNHMHKKMLHVSEKFASWHGTAEGVRSNGCADSVRKELYRGQCNCAYWHGLFGGIYLNNLRHAVYEHLIKAEVLMDASLHGDAPWIAYEMADFKRDQSQDLLITGRNLNLYFSPRDGGSLFELDFKPSAFNLSNTMTRTMEGYHRKLKLENGNNVAEKNNNHQPMSIHSISRFKEEGLQNKLIYDWYQRYSFVDHVLDGSTTLENFSLSRFSEIGNFVNARYRLHDLRHDPSEQTVSFMLDREGYLLQDRREMPLRIAKHFSINDSLMEVQAEYLLSNKSPEDINLWFGVEFNFSLLAGEDHLRYYHFPEKQEKKLFMNSKRDFINSSFFDIKDEWNGFGARFTIQPDAGVWIFPLETVSQSEEGLERTYQGSTILLHWKMAIGQGQEQKRMVRLSLYRLPGKHEPKASYPFA